MTALSQPKPFPAQAKAPHIPTRFVIAIAFGTVLNPLNSSMIAVALVSLSVHFQVNTASATWLISGFYLAGAVGMPLMGRIADRFGPRRVFCTGVLIVGVCGVLAPFSPALGWLVVIRVIQALGTSAPYPAGLAIFRQHGQQDRAPATALGALSVSSSVLVALGPVLGGFLVRFAGWQSIFVVNVPMTVAGLILAWRWLPPDRPRASGMATPKDSAGQSLLDLWKAVDGPGILLFTAFLASFLGFLLSIDRSPFWPLLPVSAVALIALLLRERSVPEPFLDLGFLSPRHPLAAVYTQFAAFTLVFYTVFYGLPLWFEHARHFDASTAGLLMLPIAAIGIVTTPVAARVINVVGHQPSLILGSLSLLAGSLLLLIFGPATPILVIVLVGVVLGIPNGFNNLGFQAALYEGAPPGRTGSAAGLFQTFRYVGAVLSAGLLGLIFGKTASSAGLHVIGAVLAAISAGLVVASLRRKPRSSQLPS